MCLQSPIRQITPTYFSDRAPTITQDQSRSIVAALQDIGLVDRSGWLTTNPKIQDVSESSELS